MKQRHRSELEDGSHHEIPARRSCPAGTGEQYSDRGIANISEAREIVFSKLDGLPQTLH
jgi:hypothetical protein